MIDDISKLLEPTWGKLDVLISSNLSPDKLSQELHLIVEEAKIKTDNVYIHNVKRLQDHGTKMIMDSLQ